MKDTVLLAQYKRIIYTQAIQNLTRHLGNCYAIAWSLSSFRIYIDDELVCIASFVDNIVGIEEMIQIDIDSEYKNPLVIFYLKGLNNRSLSVIATFNDPALIRWSER